MALCENEYYVYLNYQHNPEDFWEGPPLIKTKSRILYCVVNNDVEGLKSLINYPNFFQIADSWGYTILQIAILRDNVAVFDFLLSLDDCPLEMLDSGGETALEFVLTDDETEDIENGAYFAYSLLKKGANIDYVCNFEGNSLLHCAVKRGFLDVVRLLIEKGADLNCQNKNGDTAIRFYNFYSNDPEEILAMLLYFGADPSIPNFTGLRVVDFVLEDYNFLSTSMKETLLFYVFDEYTTDYDIPIDTLFHLLVEESPLFPQVLKHITSVNVSETRRGEGITFFFGVLFILKSEYLKLLLEKFDYVINEILDAAVIEDDFPYFYAPLNERFIENFDLLLQSQFSSDVIQIINRIQIYQFIKKSQLRNIPQEEIFQSIVLLLSYGANICDKDLELLYEIFGDCEYFRILLHMDIEITDKNQHCDTIMPILLYDIHFDIETFLKHCPNFSPKALMESLDYFAHPKLKDFCSSLENEEIDAKVKNLPSVPFLIELARNEVRKFLIQKYKVKNSMQFYTVFKYLPISKIHEKIITFETKLY